MAFNEAYRCGVGQSSLFDMIRIILEGIGIESVRIAMLCLTNLFEAIEPNPKMQFF
jgi:hypothetical protein